MNWMFWKEEGQTKKLPGPKEIPTADRQLSGDTGRHVTGCGLEVNGGDQSPFE